MNEICTKLKDKVEIVHLENDVRIGIVGLLFSIIYLILCRFLTSRWHKKQKDIRKSIKKQRILDTPSKVESTIEYSIPTEVTVKWVSLNSQVYIAVKLDSENTLSP